MSVCTAIGANTIPSSPQAIKREAAHKAEALNAAVSSQFEPDRVGRKSGNHTGQEDRHNLQAALVHERTGLEQKRSYRQRNGALLSKYPKE